MYKNEIAGLLLDIGAVFLRPDEPFTWASGIKSPVYCDNRLILTSPGARLKVETALAETLRKEWPDCELIMGTATAGIAHAAIAAHILGLPMGYVRSYEKGHGRSNRIEGRLEPGQRTVVIEDLISTGGSSLESAEALNQAGAQVMGVLSIFTYGMRNSKERFAKAGLKSVSLTDFDTLADVAREKGYIKQEDIARLIAFRENPKDESWIIQANEGSK